MNYKEKGVVEVFENLLRGCRSEYKDIICNDQDSRVCHNTVDAEKENDRVGVCTEYRIITVLSLSSAHSCSLGSLPSSL